MAFDDDKASRKKISIFLLERAGSRLVTTTVLKRIILTEAKQQVHFPQKNKTEAP